MLHCNVIQQRNALFYAGHTHASTFYDVLKADPQHKLIMRAVDSDPEGRMKRMLQDTVPVTAFVPVDSVCVLLMGMCMCTCVISNSSWQVHHSQHSAQHSSGMCETSRAPDMQFQMWGTTLRSTTTGSLHATCEAFGTHIPTNTQAAVVVVLCPACRVCVCRPLSKQQSS